MKHAMKILTALLVVLAAPAWAADLLIRNVGVNPTRTGLLSILKRMGARIDNFEAVTSVVIHTSHHTHYVIGTGAGDPQKMDPRASRETLDHSIMYIFAVALQDRRWHHVDSYAPARARRPASPRCWRRSSMVMPAREPSSISRSRVWSR